MGLDVHQANTGSGNGVKSRGKIVGMLANGI